MRHKFGVEIKFKHGGTQTIWQWNDAKSRNTAISRRTFYPLMEELKTWRPVERD